MAAAGEYRLDDPLNLPPLDVPGLLRRYGLRPDKSLGQNFLVDSAALHRVVEAADLSSRDLVLEIGPGLGSLTRFLAVSARRVVAVELDEALLPPLQEVLSAFDNVHVIQGDILTQDPARLMEDPAGAGEGYIVAANIPYYITSAVIRHLLEARIQPRRVVLTVQREVAERISARPGDMSLLALGVQVYGEPKIVALIPAGAFYPPPNVDSAVVRIDLFDEPAVPSPYLNTFFRLAKAGFSQKRKTLRNAMAGGLARPPAEVEALLQKAAIDPRRRAETLSLAEWGELSRAEKNRSDQEGDGS
jgi:16S rRNA (adenine1518-N6/adenine1519-N6)-dimethyltransferase